MPSATLQSTFLQIFIPLLNKLKDNGSLENFISLQNYFASLKQVLKKSARRQHNWSILSLWCFYFFRQFFTKRGKCAWCVRKTRAPRHCRAITSPSVPHALAFKRNARTVKPPWHSIRITSCKMNKCKFALPGYSTWFYLYLLILTEGFLNLFETNLIIILENIY